MKVIHTILREDFGRLDRSVVRAELLAEKGVYDVAYAPARNGLRIEYDPKILSNARLLDLMCRYGVYPETLRTDTDAPQRGDG